MKTAVVLSDTHGNKTDLKKIENVLMEADHIFHLGDGFFDLNIFGNEILDKTVRVAGNCDGAIGQKEAIVEIEGVKILLCHGDLYGVKRGVDRLYYRAKETGADVVFYGHTHSPVIENIEGVLIANPGNVVKYSVKKSYIYAVFHQGKTTLTINEKAFF